jgi:hypothetical protein
MREDFTTRRPEKSCVESSYSFQTYDWSKVIRNFHSDCRCLLSEDFIGRSRLCFHFHPRTQSTQPRPVETRGRDHSSALLIIMQSHITEYSLQKFCHRRFNSSGLKIINILHCGWWIWGWLNVDDRDWELIRLAWMTNDLLFQRLINKLVFRLEHNQHHDSIHFELL